MSFLKSKRHRKASSLRNGGISCVVSKDRATGGARCLQDDVESRLSPSRATKGDSDRARDDAGAFEFRNISTRSVCSDNGVQVCRDALGIGLIDLGLAPGKESADGLAALSLSVLRDDLEATGGSSLPIKGGRASQSLNLAADS